MSVHAITEQDKSSLFEQVAVFLFNHIQNLPADPIGQKSSVPTSERPIVLGLCGGRSIVGLLEAMAQSAKTLPVEYWRRLQFFMVDERVVPKEHEDSNYRLVHELFLSKAVSKGLLVESQLHPFRPQLALEDAGIASYQAELAEFGGRYDIVFLGVGEDAHVAALFPDGVWVNEQENDFVVFDDSPKPPPRRMSCTPRLLRRADLGVGLFVGEGKREALERFQSDTEPLSSCPVKILRELPEALLVSDLI